MDKTNERINRALDVQEKYQEGLDRWGALSAENTLFGQFFKIANQLGEISTSVSKILGTVENSIKVLGL